MKIVGYRTLERSNSSDLDEEVDRFLSAGWQLYGEPRHSPQTKHDCMGYMQTVILVKEEDEAAG
jgi:hypothetical protein